MLANRELRLRFAHRIAMATPFVVGIDLGTTNSCLAWSAAGGDAGGGAIVIAPTTQLTSDGPVAQSRVILPSSLYAPVAEEALRDPFAEGREATWIVGELARARGEEVPLRSITSAKSWLSHPSADPDAPSLPIGTSAGAPRLSAIDASARVLMHLARSFESTSGRRLADATVVLTVPASFDEGARASTLEAARRAGLRVSLLEEPQAAFYDWSADAESLPKLLGKKSEALVLVVDVGGGTTDLSLIAVASRDGVPVCSRVATGDHLLLGGDNMDLTLAAIARAKLEGGEGPSTEPLDAFRTGQLVRQCRSAKEALLAEEKDDAAGMASFPITLGVRGARLVGNTASTRLERKEVRRALLTGFFPAIEEGKLPPLPSRRAALVAAGLPYARDTGITRHVARFLERYGDGRAPTAVLFNGGVFRSLALRAALLKAIRSRTGARIAVLSEKDPDLAVARGAARYALLRATGGERIAAGTTRSYYVGVTVAGATRAICVVPRGTPEGVRSEVGRPVLKLRTGELARFDLFRAKTGATHAVGEVVDPVEKSFARLRPLATRVAGAFGHVDVVLAGELSPTGTLDLSLRELAGKRRSFALAFHLKKDPRPEPAVAAVGAGESNATPAATSPEAKRAEALVTAAFAFANKNGKAVAELTKELESLLGSRLTWNLLVARHMFDVLLEHRGARRWSADHERVFWSLVGVALRPGFGGQGDEARVRELFTLFGPTLAFADRAPVVQAFYVAFRRVAPGLDAEAQRTMFDVLAARLRESRSPAAEAELRELLSWLERVDAERKTALGDHLVTRANGQPSPGLFASVARLGSRVPVYGTAQTLVAPSVVEGWLARMPGLEMDRSANAASLVRMLRRTGLVSRDVSTKTIRRVAKALKECGADAQFVQPLLEVIAVTTAERGASFGEALPPGLALDLALDEFG